jgi:hypothetical protein
MITIITKGKIIYTTVIGKVTEEDFKELRNTLDKLMSEYPKIRWLYEMVEFDGWEIKTFFKDTSYSLKHTNDFEKIAMVGEKKWQEVMTALMKPFTSAEIKYFEIEEKKQAEKWIVE